MPAVAATAVVRPSSAAAAAVSGPSDVPIALPGVTDPVQPYNGQWARIDVLSVVAI